MSRPISLTPHLSTSQLEERYKACPHAAEARRWHFLLLISLGTTASQAASLVRFSSAGGYKLLHRYNQLGPTAVSDGRSLNKATRGRPSKLTPELFRELVQAVRAPHPDGSIWTGAEVARWMEARLGEPVWVQLGCVYLNRVHQTPQVPRPRHKNANPKQQARFKKTSSRKS